MLERIVWPEDTTQFIGEAVVEGLWWRAVGGSGIEDKNEKGPQGKSGGPPLMVVMHPSSRSSPVRR